MKMSHIAWTLWALVPIGLLAFHFGPGQAAYREDKAAKLVARAESLQAGAVALQAKAYEAHLAAIDARVAAFGKDDESLRKAAADAGAREEAAYALAGAEWRKTADALAEAQTYVDEIGGEVREEIRVAKARALVRTGDVAAGANELEDYLYDAGERGALEQPLAIEAREELATAYYYGARLMRLAGKPADEWREVAGRARQNFRYLAEDAKRRGARGRRGRQPREERRAGAEPRAELARRALREAACEGLAHGQVQRARSEAATRQQGAQPGTEARQGRGHERRDRQRLVSCTDTRRRSMR